MSEGNEHQVCTDARENQISQLIIDVLSRWETEPYGDMAVTPTRAAMVIVFALKEKGFI